MYNALQLRWAVIRVGCARIVILHGNEDMLVEC